MRLRATYFRRLLRMADLPHELVATGRVLRSLPAQLAASKHSRLAQQRQLAMQTHLEDVYNGLCQRPINAHQAMRYVGRRQTRLPPTTGRHLSQPSGQTSLPRLRPMQPTDRHSPLTHSRTLHTQWPARLRHAAVAAVLHVPSRLHLCAASTIALSSPIFCE